MAPEAGGRGTSVTGFEQIRVVGATTKLDVNTVPTDRHRRVGLHELTGQAGRFGAAEEVTEPVGQTAVQSAVHQGQLQAQIDAQRHRGRQRIHAEEADGISDRGFDQHAAGTAGDRSGCRGVQLVGNQQGRLVMAQVAGRNLAEGLGVVFDADGPVHNAWAMVEAADGAARLDELSP